MFLNAKIRQNMLSQITKLTSCLSYFSVFIVCKPKNLAYKPQIIAREVKHEMLKVKYESIIYKKSTIFAPSFSI